MSRQNQLMTSEAAVPPKTFSLPTPPPVEASQPKTETAAAEGGRGELSPEEDLQARRLSSTLVGTQPTQPAQPTAGTPIEVPSDTGRV